MASKVRVAMCRDEPVSGRKRPEGQREMRLRAAGMLHAHWRGEKSAPAEQAVLQSAVVEAGLRGVWRGR